MKRPGLLLAVTIAALSFWSAPAAAAPVGCTYTQNLGDMGPPDLVSIGNSFSSPTSYLDCYEFSLSSSADSFGGVLEINSLANSLGIDVSSVSLFAGNTLLSTDVTPLWFTFGPLGAGVGYTLAIAGTVVAGGGLYTAPTSYVGLFSTVASVPEPATLLLTALGIGGSVPFIRRRRRS